MIYLSICSILSYSILFLFYSILFILSIHSIYLSLSPCLSVYLPVYLQSSFFKVDSIKNAAILRDLLVCQSWQHQKRSSSARLPHFSKLTTSKTKQVCETSSLFELDNIQNEATLRDFFKFWTWQHQKQSNSARRPSKMESWVQS